jgi:BlaI family penicillinase repressor
MSDPQDLSRRERQIMDAVYRLGEASAAQVRDLIPDPPTMNAVRRQLAILEEKGHLRRRWAGPLQVFFPVVAKDEASRSALHHLRETFFGGSAARAFAALLDDAGGELSDADLERLADLIESARRCEHGEEGP